MFTSPFTNDPPSLIPRNTMADSFFESGSAMAANLFTNLNSPSLAELFTMDTSTRDSLLTTYENGASGGKEVGDVNAAGGSTPLVGWWGDIIGDVKESPSRPTTPTSLKEGQNNENMVELDTRLQTPIIPENTDIVECYRQNSPTPGIEQKEFDTVASGGVEDCRREFPPLPPLNQQVMHVVGIEYLQKDSNNIFTLQGSLSHEPPLQFTEADIKTMVGILERLRLEVLKRKKQGTAQPRIFSRSFEPLLIFAQIHSLSGEIFYTIYPKHPLNRLKKTICHLSDVFVKELVCNTYKGCLSNI